MKTALNRRHFIRATRALLAVSTVSLATLHAADAPKPHRFKDLPPDIVATGRKIHRLENHAPPERTAVVPITPEQAWHKTPSHGIGLRPDGKEVWVSKDVFGLVRVWDVTAMPPKPVADVPLYR